MRIVVADDHSLFRDGLKMILEREPDLTVVAEAEDGASAVEKIIEFQPDVAIVDISMPKLSGVEVVRTSRKSAPTVEFVIVSMHSDRQYVMEGLKTGVKSYVVKNFASHELVAAVRAAGRHEAYLSPRLSDLVISGLLEPEQKSAKNLLTAREYEAYVHLAQGKSCKDIAFDLNINFKTVETYRQRIMKKLNITNLVQLATYAMREGILNRNG